MPRIAAIALFTLLIQGSTANEPVASKPLSAENKTLLEHGARIAGQCQCSSSTLDCGPYHYCQAEGCTPTMDGCLTSGGQPYIGRCVYVGGNPPVNHL